MSSPVFASVIPISWSRSQNSFQSQVPASGQSLMCNLSNWKIRWNEIVFVTGFGRQALGASKLAQSPIMALLARSGSWIKRQCPAPSGHATSRTKGV